MLTLHPFAPSRTERKRGPCRGGSLAVLAAFLFLPSLAHAGKEDFAGGTVVFARDHSLWRTDPKGKETPTELVALPDGGRAADVHRIRSDATGAVILFDLAGAWYWLRTDAPTTIKPLPCAADARVTGDGKSVVCADADGNAVIYSFRTGKQARRKVPAAGARVIPGGTDAGGRDLVWADADGVWAAPLDAPADKRELAPDAPLRGFSASPDGTRALGVYLTTAWDKRTSVEAEGLMTFLLDGKAARRKLIRHGVVIDWSFDSTWLLVQDGESACIARATGGEYKCWKGYAAASLSPDGKWALLIGKRKKADDKKDDEEAEEGEAEGEDEEPVTEEAPGVPDRPWSVYRARLEGAYTEKPSLIETVIDGAGALWLPGKPTE